VSHIGCVKDANHPNDRATPGVTVEVAIRDQMIRLGQLLKLAGVVDDGGQARSLIDDGQVSVDGEVERRRGRQVRPGSTVELGDTWILITSQGGSRVANRP
jgi:ribosome-associated protein